MNEVAERASSPHADLHAAVQSFDKRAWSPDGSRTGDDTIIARVKSFAIVLSPLRNGLGLQTSPPNHVIIGLWIRAHS